VLIAWYQGDVRTAQFALEVSTDGTAWRELFRSASSGTTLELQGYAFDEVTARFVRIVSFGNAQNPWNSITEVEIHGPSPPPPEPPPPTLPPSNSTCAELFGSAPEFVLCGETETTCSFSACTAGDTCHEMCSRLGSACVGAIDNSTGCEEIPGNTDTCDTSRLTEICVCERPEGTPALPLPPEPPPPTPPTLPVPDVVGIPQAEAEAAISGAGLVVGEVTLVENDALPAGQVVSQDPPAGTQVAAGTAVNLAVAIPVGGNPPPDLPARPQAVPASGPVPLTVRFLPEFETATAIELFEWDFDSDGTFDVQEEIGVPQIHTYERAGRFTVTLRLTDSNREQTVGTVVVDVTNTPPQVTAEVTPSNGEVPLNVTLTATAEDPEGIARYEWDFEGDGVFDFTSPTTGRAAFTDRPVF
jgi:PASTA domain